MMRSLWISKTGMEAQQTQLDAISHNLANTATNGYKRGHAVFEDLMYQNLRQAGANTSEQSTLPTGLQMGLGTRAVGMARNFSQGNLQSTGNSLDVAIKGHGFFQVQMPDGSTGYTRDGSFQISGQGQIVTQNGYVLQPGITVPATAQAINISADGTVSATLPGQTAPQALGQIQLASFVNPGLSTVQQDTKRAGALLVETLLALINGEPAESQTIPVRLALRGSTAAK